MADNEKKSLKFTKEKYQETLKKLNKAKEDLYNLRELKKITDAEYETFSEKIESLSEKAAQLLALPKVAKKDQDSFSNEIKNVADELKNLRERKQITKEGRDKLLAELEKLQEDLKKLRENKASAYTMTGDTWHDNPYFNQLERDEGRLLIQIGEMQNTLNKAQLIDNSVRNTDTVEIGSIVKCLYGLEGDEPMEQIYEIVGQGETDVENGKIHYESPVAKNLIGHKINETIVFSAPVGKISYTIVKFYSDWEEANADK